MVLYLKNEGVWWCPSVGKTRAFWGDPKVKSMGDNGTTYHWNHETPVVPFGPLKGQPKVRVSGLALAAIPKPSEAPTVWDMPIAQRAPGSG